MKILVAVFCAGAVLKILQSYHFWKIAILSLGFTILACITPISIFPKLASAPL
jgi:hypothetical protein